MNIYFAGSIKGGRKDSGTYLELINYLKNYGNVLTEHVGDGSMTSAGEDHLSDGVVYDRDIEWLDNSEVLVAETSIPSLGVGYEIAYAEKMGKKILCLYKIGSDKKLSPMISGNKRLNVKKYNDLEEAKSFIDEFLK